MKLLHIFVQIALIKRALSECLSNSTIEALGWKALDAAVEVSTPKVCSSFYQETKAKACIELDGLADIVENETKEFAEKYSKTQFKVLSGIDGELEKFAEAQKKVNESTSSFSDDVKSAFGSAGNYINKYSSNVEKLRSVINECNLAQQTNSFGLFCLLSSNLASQHLTAQSVLESGLAALSVNMNPASALAMANRCADAIKNTCLFLEIQKALTLFDEKAFVSGFQENCKPDFLDCVNLGEAGSGCSDAIKTEIFENFSAGVMEQGMDEKTREIVDKFSDDTSELFDKLKTHGFGPVKEGVEGGLQSVKDFVNNFSTDSIKDTIGDATDTIKDNIDNSIDGIKDTFSNPFRILETKVQVSYKVTDNGYDCYENGQKSDMQYVDSVRLFLVHAMLTLSILLIEK